MFVKPGSVLFGTTVFGQDVGVYHNLLARAFVVVYNAGQTFNNQQDTRSSLEHALGHSISPSTRVRSGVYRRFMPAFGDAPGHAARVGAAGQS